MGLILHETIAPGATLVLWKIEETTEELAALCLADDRVYAAGLSAKRQYEWLAWRALLRTVEPGAVAEYDVHGGPTLRNGRCLGVSHTAGYAALVVADVPCAIDIELVGRDYSRTLARFAAADEQIMVQAVEPALFPALIWCAKETLYKWARVEGVDFLHELHIDAIDPAVCQLRGTHRGQPLKMHYRQIGDICCVYGLE